MNKKIKDITNTIDGRTGSNASNTENKVTTTSSNSVRGKKRHTGFGNRASNAKPKVKNSDTGNKENANTKVWREKHVKNTCNYDNIVSVNRFWEVNDMVRHVLCVTDSDVLLMLSSVNKKLRELFVKSVMPPMQLSLLITRFRILFDLRDLITPLTYQKTLLQVSRSRQPHSRMNSTCTSIHPQINRLPYPQIQEKVTFAKCHSGLTLKIAANQLDQLGALISSKDWDMQSKSLLQINELDLSAVYVNYLTIKTIYNVLAFFATSQLKVLNLGNIGIEMNIDLKNLKALTFGSILSNVKVTIKNCEKLEAVIFDEICSGAHVMLEACPNLTMVTRKAIYKDAQLEVFHCPKVTNENLERFKS